MASLGARTLGRVLGASAARAPVRPMLHRAFSVPHMADKVVSVTFSNNAGAEAVKRAELLLAKHASVRSGRCTELCPAQ
jgi:hypothetical protein